MHDFEGSIPLLIDFQLSVFPPQAFYHTLLALIPSEVFSFTEVDLGFPNSSSYMLLILLE
jgi:hypothetical protein